MVGTIQSELVGKIKWNIEYNDINYSGYNAKWTSL